MGRPANLKHRVPLESTREVDGRHCAKHLRGFLLSRDSFARLAIVGWHLEIARRISRDKPAVGPSRVGVDVADHRQIGRDPRVGLTGSHELVDEGLPVGIVKRNDWPCAGTIQQRHRVYIPPLRTLLPGGSEQDSSVVSDGGRCELLGAPASAGVSPGFYQCPPFPGHLSEGRTFTAHTFHRPLGPGLLPIPADRRRPVLEYRAPAWLAVNPAARTVRRFAPAATLIVVVRGARPAMADVEAGRMRLAILACHQILGIDETTMVSRTAATPYADAVEPRGELECAHARALANRACS